MQEKLRAHIEEIVPLTDDEFASIRAHFISRKVRKHQFLIQEGDGVHYAYFVVSGLLKLAHIDANGKEHILHFATDNWWVSDYQAWFRKTKATMSLDCLEDAEVLCISLEDHNKLMASFPKLEHFFLEKSHLSYIASQQRILSLLSTSAKERYEQFLQQYPTLVQRVNKTLLASYLGISRETLSRLSV
jgi:CRP-like cAMP-binding protein